MSIALFINGIFESVLVEILEAQKQGANELFLQPFKKVAVVMLRDNPPDSDNPVRLYISTTDDLGRIRYTCEIVRWENKKEISERRRKVVTKQLKKHQGDGEVKLFSGKGKKGKDSINLITIRNLIPLAVPRPVSALTKVSNNEPLKKRTQPGNWSQVFDNVALLDNRIETESEFESQLQTEIRTSEKLSNAELKKRLAKAKTIPEKVQLITTGFRRNPNVIVAVLRRANGVCERCDEPAPFARKSDGTPYLEVHHWKPLSKGGKDTVDNAGALCPNCHREEHQGE